MARNSVFQASMFTPGQVKFINTYSGLTGLSPGVVAAEVLNEESSGAAQQRERQGIHNWLNIGYTDSGQRGTGNSIWGNPVSAAQASANWIKGSYSVPGFGHASQGIQNILKSAGGSPAAQIAAIQGSGWASSGYPNLPSLYKQVTGSSPGNVPTGGAPSGRVPSGGAPLNLPPLGGASPLGQDPIASALISTMGRDPGEVNQALLGAALSPRAPSSSPSLSQLQPWSASSALPSAGPRRSLQSGKVTLAPGADRSGVSIKPSVMDFVGQVAGLSGQPLTIGTGTNHDRLTVNGTQSDHWTGNAADIPSSGANLIKLGQDALIAAGMPAAKARQQQGGGYNIGPYQIIFNTDAPGWGNHYDHLHVGIRGQQ